MTIYPFTPCHHPRKRDLPSEMESALWCGRLDKVWKLVNAGEEIPGLSGDDSNLRIIIQNCPDLSLIKRVLNSMTIEEINYTPPSIKRSALRQAALRYNVPVVELLLNAKADVNLASSTGVTPLHAVANFNFENLHIRKSTPDTEKQDIQDIFQSAVQTAQLLIRSGASIDCTRHGGKTPLYECMNEPEGFLNTDLITLLVSECARPVILQFALKGSPERLSRINQAVQDGLIMRHRRQEEVTQALSHRLSNPVAALVAEYV